MSSPTPNPARSAGKGCGCLYLRATVGVVNALFVLGVAATALVVTATSSLSALDNNGKEHVTALGNAATFRVTNFFERPFQQATALSAMSLTHHLAFPSEDPSAKVNDATRQAVNVPIGGFMFDRVTILSAQSMFDFNMSLFATGYWLADGSRVLVFPIPQVQNAVYLEKWWRDNITNDLSHRETIMYDIESGLQIHADDPRHGVFMPSREGVRLTDASEPATFNTLSGLVYLGRSSPVRWSKPRFFHETVPYRYILAMLPTYNATHLLGFSISGITLNRIGIELDEVKTSSKSVVLVVLAGGHVLGASGGLSTFNVSDYNGTALPDGCASTDQTKSTVPSDRRLISCMHHIRDIPIAVARSIEKSHSFEKKITRTEQFKVSSSGERYFARIQPVSSYLGLNASVVVAVPEKEILGNVERSILVAALITIGAVVVAAGACSALLWWMLHPLQGIAEQMGKAARLEEDPTPVNVSSFVEIGDLQEAFLAMRDKLDRIRSYVPQSLLHAADHESTSDCEDCECIDIDRPSSSGHPSSPGAARPHSVSVPSSLDSNTGLGSPQHPHRFASRVTHGSTMSSQGTPNGNAAGATISAAPSGVVNPASMSSLSCPKPGAHLPPPQELAVFARSPPVHEHLNAPAAFASRSGSTVGGRVPRHGVTIIDGIRRESVSVLAVNVCNFHKIFARRSMSDQHETMSKLVNAVLNSAKMEKGVVDSFQGDRFLISFNAVRPAANHEIRATRAAMDIIDTVGNFGLRVTSGVASGPAHIGNMGSKGMMRFTIMGPVVAQAVTLERLCKVYSSTSQHTRAAAKSAAVCGKEVGTTGSNLREERAGKAESTPMADAMIQRVRAMTPCVSPAADAPTAAPNLNGPSNDCFDRTVAKPNGQSNTGQEGGDEEGEGGEGKQSAGGSRRASVARTANPMLLPPTVRSDDPSTFHLSEIGEPDGCLVRNSPHTTPRIDPLNADGGLVGTNCHRPPQSQTASGTQSLPPMHQSCPSLDNEWPAVQCLVPQRLFMDLTTAAFTRTVDIVHLPHAKTPCLIASVEKLLRSAVEDEWMYQLEAQTDAKGACCPVSLTNAVWEACAKREFSKAQELLRALEEEAKKSPVGAIEIRRCVRCPRLRANCGGPSPRDLGEFYTTALLQPANE